MGNQVALLERGPPTLDFQVQGRRCRVYQFSLWQRGRDRTKPAVLVMDQVLDMALRKKSSSSSARLEIVEACVGRRWTELQSYRVIGIKCEGMSSMGFVYCQRVEYYETEDSSDEEEIVYVNVMLQMRDSKGTE